MSAISYNCTSLDSHLKNNCGREIMGGSAQCVLFAPGHTVTDFTSGSQIQTNITSGYAVLVQNVKIGMPRPNPITIQPHVSNEVEKVVNYDRQLDYTDGNVNSQNVNTFYNEILGGQKLSQILLFEDGESGNTRCTLIQGKISGSGGRVIPDTNGDTQRFEVTFKWRRLAEPQIISTPSGIFVEP